MVDFAGLVDNWKTKALAYEESRLAYELAFAAAYVSSEAKSVDARKAEAELKTADQRRACKMAEVERDAAYHVMIFYRGGAQTEAA